MQQKKAELYLVSIYLFMGNFFTQNATKAFDENLQKVTNNEYVSVL